MNIVEDSLDNINYGGEESKFDIKSHRATEFEKKESTRKEKVENSAPHININAFSQTQSQASQISTAFAQPTFGQSGFGFGQPIFGQSGFGSSSFSNITLKIPSGGGFARFARSSSGFGSASITSKSVDKPPNTSLDPTWFQIRK
ncbi:hypothetical protein RhiirA5_400656 [Rhizophagus irregularis]|nr:hypothetical protein RhiirA5_400656 [Rhizophagus irregularis]PKY18472.1 hypothetical protein RhiirB3_468581 [Rhizophagus irregularis]CAB5216668.1 unnamed protein product [Rhizophagus irregularis]CAB5378478.1 unnamed protein product [Rhizophagus irregularis]